VTAQRTPLGINVAGGTGAVVLAALVAAWIPGSAPVEHYAPLVVVLAAFAALTVDTTAVALTGLLGFLVFDGFLVNQLGELSWHGVADRWRVLAVVVAGLAGMAGGGAYRFIRRDRVWRYRSEQVRRWAGPAPSEMEEEWHGV
jgi:hypothetical protein